MKKRRKYADDSCLMWLVKLFEDDDYVSMHTFVSWIMGKR